MELHPKRPPGRADRKAALYASEIARLRLGGHTFESIREALADVGITASTSALRRELRRFNTQSRIVPRAPQAAPRTPADVSTPSSAVSAPRPATSIGSNGREIAEAFFDTHPSNSLFQTQEIP